MHKGAAWSARKRGNAWRSMTVIRSKKGGKEHCTKEESDHKWRRKRSTVIEWRRNMKQTRTGKKKRREKRQQQEHTLHSRDRGPKDGPHTVTAPLGPSLRHLFPALSPSSIAKSKQKQRMHAFHKWNTDAMNGAASERQRTPWSSSRRILCSENSWFFVAETRRMDNECGLEGRGGG